ncbi:MAG: hypothetical protein K2M91_13835 [Lachnospiraceae bacterium]|nr:hypothetical protein [Lachnospiraceae bacterium]
MDIYAVEKQEGCYLANELEKLRRKRIKGSVAVKCSPTNNKKIMHFRKSFLLDHGTTDVFTNAKQYYIVIDNSTLSFTLVYDACHIIYCLHKEIDWKYIELEIIDISLCQNIVPNKAVIAGRAEVTTFQVLVAHALIYGFYKAFRPQSDSFVADVFEKIANADELKKAEFGLKAKITSLIFKMT